MQIICIMAAEKHIHSSNNRLDLVGMSLSVICAIHCISVPVVAVMTPHISGFFDSHAFHEWISFLIVPVALVTLWQSVKYHKTAWPIVSGVIGLLVVLFAVMAYPKFITEDIEVMLTVTGSGFLVLTHYLNWRACRCSHEAHA